MTRSTARQWLVLCLLALGLVAVSTGGCSDGECGGVLGENGQCQELCDESECVSGYRCVGNQCRMPCSFDGECYAGQACTSANTDNGQPGKYCIGESPSMGMDVGFLRDDSCSISTDCNQALHLRCVDQICDIACETHADCSSLGVCTATNQDVEGNTLGACEADGFPRAPGQYGSQCVFESCDNEAGFGCFGARAGDLDSYCTQFDCQSDLECPAGFECTLTHDGRPPCSSDICSFPGDPEHPNCVPDDRIGDGQDYQCGPMLLHFSVCVQRDFCSPCESDNDCLAVPNQICALNLAGDKICTVLCDPDLAACPWGNASVCGVWDEELGLPTCSHRFGACQGEGLGCDPCTTDDECPGGYCVRNSFSGERHCLDKRVVCSCPETEPFSCLGGGCPLTPGNLEMKCLDGLDYVDTVIEFVCDSPQTGIGGARERQSCWPVR